jgi:hypothetical protein
MASVALKVLPILEPISGHLLGPTAAPSYLERFLEIARKLMRGSAATSRSARRASLTLTHVEKIDLLSGILPASSIT